MIFKIYNIFFPKIKIKTTLSFGFQLVIGEGYRILRKPLITKVFNIFGDVIKYFDHLSTVLKKDLELLLYASCSSFTTECKRLMN